MNILTQLGVAALITSSIGMTYPQNLSVNNILTVENSISIGEENYYVNSNKLEEKLKIPQLLPAETYENKELIYNINSIIKSQIYSRKEEAEESANEYFNEIGEIRPNFPFSIYSDYEVGLDNDKLASFYMNYYEYLGGAHGMTTRYSYTIDKEKVKILEINDLFKENYDYKNVIDKFISKEIDKNSELYFDKGMGFNGIKENQEFYLEDGYIVIYFQLYEIAPYVAGIQEFRIPISTFGDNYVA